MEINIGELVVEKDVVIGQLDLDVIKAGATIGKKSITENGTYRSVEDGLDGYNVVQVSVSEPKGTVEIDYNGTFDVKNSEFAKVNVLPILDEKIVTPTKEEQIVMADNEYDGLSKVVVNGIPDEYIIPVGTLNIMENGVYDVLEKKYARMMKIPRASIRGLRSRS